jgi:hypothetical protein
MRLPYPCVFCKGGRFRPVGCAGKGARATENSAARHTWATGQPRAAVPTCAVAGDPSPRW